MNKKSILAFILLISFVFTGFIVAAELQNDRGNKAEHRTKQAETVKEMSIDKKVLKQDKLAESSNSSKASIKITPALDSGNNIIEKAMAGFASDTTTDLSKAETYENTNILGQLDTSLEAAAKAPAMPQLILNCRQVDYKAYIPKMQYDDELKAALDISNPFIKIDAKAAILFDADTQRVLYYKNPVQVVFPASTLKLLTSLVALSWCSEDEQVTIGDEIKLIASDSTRAYLRKGEVLTLKNLLEAMLLPSGNDAAYAVAAYVGRKSLNNPKATREEAVSEFIRLMNNYAKLLGVKNSCFKTPDGYDAIGQYTTAYDMGLIGMAAADNKTILEVTRKSSSRNSFVSGQDITWNNTNKLISRYSGEYYSPAIGLKTGTSTMAGRCLISAAKKDGRKVVCVIMNSTIAGRWEDAIKLLKYALK
jgi:D-alanyl-D-alanine carboxypeptidase